MSKDRAAHEPFDYSGLCVGGPLDGEFLASTSTRRELVAGAGLGMAKYVYVLHLHATLGTVRLWTLEGMSFEDGVRKILTAYCERAEKRRVQA